MTITSLALRQPTFRGEATGEPLGVGAVVVDHVHILRLLQLLLPLHVVQPSCSAVKPVAAAGRWALAAHPRGPARLATVGAVVPEVGGEGRLGPVRLDAPALRRPVVRVPQAGVEPHRLALGERHPLALQVAEVPDGHVVHHEAAGGAKEHGHHEMKKLQAIGMQKKEAEQRTTTHMTCLGFQRME